MHVFEFLEGRVGVGLCWVWVKLCWAGVGWGGEGRVEGYRWGRGRARWDGVR